MKTPRRVTAAQVKELRRQLNQGASLRTAAMRANMDRKSARKYRKLGQLPNEARKPHTWRTRPDPLAEVWPAVAEQLQQEPRLQAKTLWEWLQQTQPGKCPESVRRTFERRVRRWKAQFGLAKEVFFTQVHAPGRLAASDFTSMNDLHVTIAGAPLPHLVYHFVLTHSNWEHATLCFGEDFASLSAGLQNALWALGAVPERHRTDRLSLAVHHDGQPEQFTAKYRALMGHYGVQAEATNPASGHENGDVESSHRHFKAAVGQALLLRGSRDFASRAAYWQLVVAVLEQRNAGRTAKLTEEMRHLRPLPAGRIETLERERVRVRRTSTIQVKHNTYSVPSRLRGEEVEVRIGMEEIEVWYAQQLVQRMPRLRGQNKHRIDYRHIIGWLVRKPGAFARYVYREDMYPTLSYRRAYDTLVEQQSGRADKEYVRLLYLASAEGEAKVEEALIQLLDQRQPVSEPAVRTILGGCTPLAEAAVIVVPAVDLSSYDALLEGDYEASSASCMSQEDQGLEESHEQGCIADVDEVPAGAASAGGACTVRGGGSASECRIVELSGLFTGGTGEGVSATATATDRTHVKGVAATAGEELGDVRPEASAIEGGAAIPGTVERRLCGSAGERFGFRRSGVGENARAVRGSSGVGAFGPKCPVHDDGPVGAETAGSQTRLETGSVVEAAESLGNIDPGRPGLCTTKSRGDGGTVHTAGGALRTEQRVPDEQFAVLEVGRDLQRCHDSRGGDRPAGASQRNRGAERAELSGRGCQTGEGQPAVTVVASPAKDHAQRGG
jgi:Mu transposase, C-terminal domain